MNIASIVNCHRNSFDVMIDRSSIFGNPFSHRSGTLADHVVASREVAIDLYRQYLRSRLTFEPEFRAAFLKLRGKRLGCHCKPKSCHGDVIVEFLNNGWTPAIKLFTYKPST